jgi:3-phenylpropionate/trans-cinnamate dioxygenase ferredoxin subunit
MGKLHKIADRSALAPDKPLCVQVEGRPIALFDLAGNCYAIDDTCTHAGGPLSEGEVEDGAVVCPWHGARFDLRSGAVLAPPAGSAVRSYPVKIQGREVWVEVD